MKKALWISLGIILLAFVLSILFYSQMPEQVASHWNSKGEVDGYMSKFWGLFLMPILSVALLFLLFYLPKIDPLKENVEKFRRYYDGFIIVLIAYLFYLHFLVILWNLGTVFNMAFMMIPAFAALFFYIGIMTEKAKRNWFIGVKTPWTLSNEKVWNKTHKLAGRLFKIAALIALVGFFFPEYAIWFFIIPVVYVAVYSIIYSYFEYQKQVKK
jgi:uncharacterized membrane protein